MNIKTIAVGVCLSAVAVGAYAANYTYPSLSQAAKACSEWKKAGGTYEYTYKTTKQERIPGSGWKLTSGGMWLWKYKTVPYTEQLTGSYRSCRHGT